MKRHLIKLTIQAIAVSVGILTGGTIALSNYLDQVGARPEVIEREVGMWAQTTSRGAIGGGVVALLVAQLLVLEGRKKSDEEITIECLQTRLQQISPGSTEAFDILNAIAYLKAGAKR